MYLEEVEVRYARNGISQTYSILANQLNSMTGQYGQLTRLTS